MKSTALIRGTTLLAASIMLAACGGDDTDSTDDDNAAAEESADDQADPADEAESDDEMEPEVELTEFTVAFTSVGLGSLPLLAAIDELRDDGHTIETPELAESELVAEGVAQGRFAFGSGANNGTMIAVEQGASIKWIVDRTANEWLVYAREGIDGCQAVAESRIAIHSPGSVSGAMLRDWINNNCPDANYEPLIIEGSQNRLAAMLADQIDASPVEFGDALLLDEEGGFRQVVSFAADVPDLHPTSVYGNTDWMADNPEATQALIRELLLQHRQINSEPGYLMQLMEEYLPEEAAGESAQAITDAYVEAEIFPNNGGLNDAAVEYTIGFFGPDGTGDVESSFSVDDVSDLSYLEAVLDEIGTE